MIKSIHSISDLQRRLADSLRALRDLDGNGKLPAELRPLLHLAPPPELAADVSLRHRDNDRQIKNTAAVSSWVPGACGVWIEYVPEEDSESDLDKQATSHSPRDVSYSPIKELIRRLDEVQRDPRWKFTSWTWFRDQYLPSHGWTASKEDTQKLMEELVRIEVARTEKVQNPKHPQFPVAALALDRRHPLVEQELGAQSRQTKFAPVRIPGRSVSEMIIEDRR